MSNDGNDVKENDVEVRSKESPFDQVYANRALALFVILSGLIVYIEAMLIPSLPKISAQYGLTISQSSLVLSFPMVLGTAIIPVVGKLGDIYGKKRLLTYVLLIYLASVAGSSFAPNFIMLLASRTLQGIGLGIFPLAFGLVREEFPRNLVPRAEGMIGAMEGAGIAFGLSLGAYVSNIFGWQANFQIAVPFVAILLVLILISIRESANRKPNAKLDYIGAAWLGFSLASIVLGLSEVSNFGWTSPIIVILILGGLVSIAPLILYERRVKESVLSLRLLRMRNVLLSNVMILISGISTYGGFLAITYELELPHPGGYGFDTFTTGLYLLPLSLTIFAVAYPVGTLIPKYGAKPFLYLGGFVGAFGFFLISTATSATEIATYLVIASAGLGTLFVATSNLLILSVRKSDMGISTSLNTVFSNIGTSLGPPLLGSILSSFSVSYMIGNNKLTLPSPNAFHYSFYLTVFGLLVLVLLTVFAQEVIGRRANKEVLQESDADQNPTTMDEGLTH